MKNVKLKFNDTWVDVEDGWLCIGDSENQILLKPEFFNKLLAAINYTHSCESDSEQLIAFAEWKEYNGKWETHKQQVKNFLKEYKSN